MAMEMRAARKRSSAARIAGIGCTAAGSPLYGTSTMSVPSRSKITPQGFTRRVFAVQALGYLRVTGDRGKNVRFLVMDVVHQHVA